MSFKRFTFIAVLFVAAFGIAWLMSGRGRDDGFDMERVATTPRPVPRAPEPRPIAAPAPSEHTGEKEQPAAPPALGEFRFKRDDDLGEGFMLSAPYGFARWQPSDHKLRVLLTERPLSAEETAALLDIVGSPARTTPAVGRAVMELTFVPTAQAFDRNDLDTAVLTVTTASGATTTADILGSIEWRGSLPSAQTVVDGLARAAADLELTASGSYDNGDRSRQSWKLDIALPVKLAD